VGVGSGGDDLRTGPAKAGHIREAAGMKESWFYRLLKERRDAAGTS